MTFEILFFLCVGCYQPYDYQISELSSIAVEAGAEAGVNVTTAFSNQTDTTLPGIKGLHVPIATSLCEQSISGLGTQGIEAGRKVPLSLIRALQSRLSMCVPGPIID